MDIRWDTSLMAELSASLENKSAQLAALRHNVYELCRRHGPTRLELRHLAMASVWAHQHAADLMGRRRRLLDAEAALLWHLQIRPANETYLPPLRSRSVSNMRATAAASETSAASA